MTPEERYISNENLAYGFINRFYPTYAKDEDCIQLAKIELWLACISFDENKGVQFSSYAYAVMHNEMKKYFAKVYRKKRQSDLCSVSMETPLDGIDEKTLADCIANDKEDYERFEEITSAKQSVDYIFSTLTPAQKRHLKAYMDCGCNGRKAAMKLGVRHQAVFQTVNMVKKRFKDKKQDLYFD